MYTAESTGTISSAVFGYNRPHNSTNDEVNAGDIPAESASNIPPPAKYFCNAATSASVILNFVVPVKCSTGGGSGDAASVFDKSSIRTAFTCTSTLQTSRINFAIRGQAPGS